MDSISPDLIFEGEFPAIADSAVLRIEDDGEVAYAYYWDNGRIEGYVWLYNRGPTPPSQTRRGEGRPQLNPLGYAGEGVFPPIIGDSDVGVSWDESKNRFSIRLHGQMHAVVGRGDTPGWCVLAVHPNPLARVLEMV